MVKCFKKIFIIVFLLFLYFFSLSQTDSVTRVCFHADTTTLPDFYFNYIKIEQNYFYNLEKCYFKIKYIKAKQSEKKFGQYSKSGIILILSKEFLIINDTIIANSNKEKKNLRLLFNNHIIVKVKKISKKQTKKKYGWWRGRHGGIIIETKEIE